MLSNIVAFPDPIFTLAKRLLSRSITGILEESLCNKTVDWRLAFICSNQVRDGLWQDEANELKVKSRERIDIEEYIQYLNIVNLIDYDLNEILRNNCLKIKKARGIPGPG